MKCVCGHDAAFHAFGDGRCQVYTRVPRLRDASKPIPPARIDGDRVTLPEPMRPCWCKRFVASPDQSTTT